MKMTELLPLKVYPFILNLLQGGSSNNVPHHIFNIQDLQKMS